MAKSVASVRSRVRQLACWVHDESATVKPGLASKRKRQSSAEPDAHKRRRLSSDDGFQIKSVLSGLDTHESSVSISDDDSDTSEDVPEVKQSERVFRNYEKEVLQHRNETCVTPNVGKIASALFLRTLLVVGLKDEAQDSSLEQETCNLDELSWPDDQDTRLTDRRIPTKMLGKSIHIDSDGKSFYSRAYVHNFEVCVGDVVQVICGEDGYHGRQTSGTFHSKYDSVWFGRIKYMWTSPDLQTSDGALEPQVHFHWYIHGARTVLKETANSRELFVTDEADDCPISCIIRKIKLKHLSNEENEPSNLLNNEFFYRYCYDDASGSFEDAKAIEDPNRAFLHCPPHRQCHIDERAFKRSKAGKIIKTSPSSFSLNGFDYAAFSFVFITPEKEGPYLLAYVESIEWESGLPQLYLRNLIRRTELSRGQKDKCAKEAHIHERELVFTKDFTSFTRYEQLITLDGTFIARHLNCIEVDLQKYERLPDTFWYNSQLRGSKDDPVEIVLMSEDTIKFDSRSFEETDRRLSALVNGDPKVSKIRVMDIFSGAGGLSVGFEDSGLESTWAIEFGPAAAATYKANHPNSTVYNQCSNLLLKHAWDSSEGKQVSSLRPIFKGPGDMNFLPHLPSPGEVDMICCGPPCQGFSSLNMYKKADDIKSSLVANALSYCDFYRPRFFLLENVRGLLKSKLQGYKDGHAVNGGIEQGYLKFIVRTLLSIGYQCRFSLLQAGHYGAPQSRRRIIFLAARIGESLPDFPQPSHTFPADGHLQIQLPSGRLASHIQRKAGFAPNRFVSMEDAIGDLPAFDWHNPHIVIPPSQESTLVEAQRARLWPVLSLHDRKYIGYDNVPYLRPPLTPYQALMRSRSTCVRQHYTQETNDKSREIVCNIPLRGNADHRDLPDSLKPWHLSHKDSAAAKNNFWPGAYSRTDKNGFFRTITTSMEPSNKNGGVIHYSQHRVFTIREAARGQGFPDNFVFKSVRQNLDRQHAQDLYRLIGNAVPVPLGFALGLQIMLANLRQFESESPSAKSRMAWPDWTNCQGSMQHCRKIHVE